MTKLDWSAPGQRLYEMGVDQGVLYVGGIGYAWPGLVSVSESTSGGDPKPFYIDGYKYLNLASAEDYAATIEAFSCPAEFGPCDGAGIIQNGLIATQQPRKSFGFSYRSRIGNDTQGTDYGYKIHVIYNALAGPSNQKYSTLSDKDTPDTRSWDITTLAPSITSIRPTAHFVIDSTTTDPATLVTVENTLYGSDDSDATLPLVADLIAMFGVDVSDAGFPQTDEALTILDGGAP